MTPTVPPDSNQISLKIIEAVKQHPVLYSTEVKGLSARLQEFKQKVWYHISEELGLDCMFMYELLCCVSFTCHVILNWMLTYSEFCEIKMEKSQRYLLPYTKD